MQKALQCPLATDGHTISAHPDTGQPVAGEPLPAMAACRKLVIEAHRKLLPGVPLAGWDVAVTEPEGVLLLEANLSCNFFRATFDVPAYCAFAESVFAAIERQ